MMFLMVLLMNLTLIVCQSNMSLNSTNFKYACCDFNLKLKKCHSNNYIIVKYNDDIEYTSGFINVYFPLNNAPIPQPGRNGISYIINGNSIYRRDERLKIAKNNSIEIHLFHNITTLENFFYDQYSPKIIIAF